MVLRRVRSRFLTLIGRSAARRGFRFIRVRDWHLVRRNYYAPVPDLEALPDDVWDRRTTMRGIAFDVDTQIAFAERELAPFVAEAAFPRTAPPGEFALDNAMYSSADAEIAYAMVRRFKPARIVELGSGFSTLAMARACVANEAQGAPVRLEAFDAHPRGVVPDSAPGVAAVHAIAAQDVSLDTFAGLTAGDILFVDTSHAVRMAGDVNFVVLEVLPLLAPGVLVHFHDIWLPYEYHRALTEILGMHWTEQYLLQAYLAGNADVEVLFATQAVVRAHRERMEALVPSFDSSNHPSGFWLRIRRNETSGAG